MTLQQGEGISFPDLTSLLDYTLLFPLYLSAFRFSLPFSLNDSISIAAYIILLMMLTDS